MYALTALRVTIGWLFLNAGIAKLADSAWSAAGYLKGATTLPGFFAALTDPGVMPIINFLVEWGLVLLGLGLIFGICVKWSAYLGSLLMFLFYLPVLDFPKVGHGYLVDEHIIYIAGLLTLAAFDAGKVWGLEDKVHGMFRRWMQ